MADWISVRMSSLSWVLRVHAIFLEHRCLYGNRDIFYNYSLLGLLIRIGSNFHLHMSCEVPSRYQRHLPWCYTKLDSKEIMAKEVELHAAAIILEILTRKLFYHVVLQDLFQIYFLSLCCTLVSNWKFFCWFNFHHPRWQNNTYGIHMLVVHIVRWDLSTVISVM